VRLGPLLHLRSERDDLGLFRRHFQYELAQALLQLDAKPPGACPAAGSGDRMGRVAQRLGTYGPNTVDARGDGRDQVPWEAQRLLSFVAQGRNVPPKVPMGTTGDNMDQQHPPAQPHQEDPEAERSLHAELLESSRLYHTGED